MRRIVMLVVLVLSLLLAVAGPALADDAPGYADVGAAFGEHVSTMAQEGHLGQDCNPGHHQGITGWDPDHHCHQP
jgi:hypothetical protein